MTLTGGNVGPENQQLSVNADKTPSASKSIQIKKRVLKCYKLQALFGLICTGKRQQGRTGGCAY
jgi:hypothetical protein